MKYDNLRAFEKHLEGAQPDHFSNCYLIIGKESFDCKEATDLLVKALLPEASQRELSLKQYQGDKLSVEVILNELNSLSFFCTRKVIIVHQVEKLKKEELKSLEATLDRLPRTYFLILVSESLSTASTFYKKAEKSGVVLDFPDLKPWEREKRLMEWTAKQAAAYRKNMPYQAVQLLVKQIGPDPALLEQEFQKLLCYVGERKEITPQDIQAISTASHTETIWQLGEAIFMGDRKAAIHISRAMLSDDTALLSLLRQIRSQFQTEYQVCSLLNSGGGAQAVSAEFPYMRGQILENHIRMAGRYGMERFKKGLLAIDAAELKAKSSGPDPELLLELLILQLTDKS